MRRGSSAVPAIEAPVAKAARSTIETSFDTLMIPIHSWEIQTARDHFSLNFDLETTVVQIIDLPHTRMHATAESARIQAGTKMHSINLSDGKRGKALSTMPVNRAEFL